MTKKTSESEGNKRYYTSITRDYIKGKRIKLTPNERALLGLIVDRSQAEGTINLANRTICDVFGWDPQQLYRACKGLIAKNIISKDITKAVHGQQGSEYTLLERDEAEQQPAEAPVQYQPILVQAPAEPPHVKPFHEQQTQQNDNEVISLLKQQNDFLHQQLEALNRKMEALGKQVETLNKKVELLLNTLICQSKSSVSPSNVSVDTLPRQEEIVDSTPTPHTDLSHCEDEPPTPNEPFGEQSEYLMAIATAEAGGTIGGLTDTPIEPNERERLIQEARCRARKVKSRCEEKGMDPRQAAMKAREAIEEEYSSKLGGDNTFEDLLLNLNYYGQGAMEESPI